MIHSFSLSLSLARSALARALSLSHPLFLTQAVITPCSPALATPALGTSSQAGAPVPAHRWFLGACATSSGVAATAASPTDELEHWGFFPGYLDEVPLHPRTARPSYTSAHASARCCSRARPSTERQTVALVTVALVPETTRCTHTVQTQTLIPKRTGSRVLCRAA